MSDEQGRGQVEFVDADRVSMPRTPHDDFEGYKKIQAGLYFRAALSKSKPVVLYQFAWRKKKCSISARSISIISFITQMIEGGGGWIVFINSAWQ